MVVKEECGPKEELECYMLATVFTVVCLLDEWQRTIREAFPSPEDILATILSQNDISWFRGGQTHGREEEDQGHYGSDRGI